MSVNAGGSSNTTTMTNQGDENDSHNNKTKTPSGVAAAIQAFEGRLSSSQHNQQPLSPVPPTPKNKVLYQQSSLRSISSPYRERGPSGYASPNSSKVSSLHHSAPNLDTSGEMSPNPHLQQSSKPKAKTNATKSPPTQRSNATEVTAKDDEDVMSDDSTNPYHSDEEDNNHHDNNKEKNNNPTATSPTPLAAPSIETTSGSVASGSKQSHGGGSKRSLHSAATPPSTANRSPTPTAIRPHFQSPRSNKSTPPHPAKQASPIPRRPTPNTASAATGANQSNKSLQNGIPTTLHIPEMRPPSPMASPRPLPHDPPQPTAVAAPDMSPYRELQQQQQRLTVPQPPNLLSTTATTPNRPSQQQQRVVRSFSQKAAATSPGSHKSAEVSAASSSSIIPDTDAPPPAEAPESVPPKANNPESAAAPKEKFPPKTRVPRGARGLFVRSSRSNTPLARSTTPAGTTSAAAAAAAPAVAPNDPNDRRVPSRGRSWLGSFRGKPVKGKPEALVVVSPDVANNERSTSVGSAASRGSFTARVVLAATRRGSSHHKRPTPQSVGGASVDTETPVEENNTVDAATAQLVQSLTRDPNATVTRQTAESALQELQTLQTELGTLRQSQPPSVQRVEHLQEELASAQKAASQLESLNKSYRKTQKQMLHDLQEAQAELEKYRDLKLNASFSGEAQQLAEELASTMAELLALREQHEALLRQTTTNHTQKGDVTADPNGLAGGKDSDGYYQHETQLNLQKDLAHAMATISKLEEENDLLRQQVQKLESMEEAVAKLKMERDEYASQVQDQKIYGGPSGGAPSAAATATIDRLQTEKKQLLSNELALKQRLTKLETKNKNQKEIFKTAVEIKDVEFQINKKERDLLASRLEEVEQERTTQAEVHQQEVERLEARVKEVQADHKQSKAQVRLATEQAQQMARELEAKQGEVEVLAKNQDEFEAKEAALNHRIHELEEEMERKQEEIASLEERARLETFKARRVMEDKVGELQEQLKEREATLTGCQEQVQTLQEELQENRGEVERLRRRHSSLTRRSGDGDDDASSQRLSALRSRIDNHETTLRSRMDTIRNMESPTTKRRTYSPAEEARPLELSSDTLENSVAADEELEDSHLVLEDDDARVNQLEGELGVAKSRIAELEAELSSKHDELEDAKTNRSAIPMRETEASDVESNDNEEDVQEIHRLETSLRESDERINQLKDQLKDARTRLLEAQSSTHSTASSHSHETTHIDASQAEAEIEALISQLAEKEEACCDLQKLVDQMETDQKNSEQQLQETRSKLANTEEQLLEVSKHQNSPPPSNDHPESTERITVLEQELRSSQARLVEADSKIEMLEEFIAQDDTDFSHGSSVVDVKHLQDTLAEKEKEISRLSKLAENGEKVEELQERLNASEKAAKDLEIQNEKLSKSQSSNGGMNETGAGDDDVMTRMKFLEEQNAAYAASLKALRIEIATRHEGTAFE